jgi:hypothetical protein
MTLQWPTMVSCLGQLQAQALRLQQEVDAQLKISPRSSRVRKNQIAPEHLRTMMKFLVRLSLDQVVVITTVINDYKFSDSAL